MARVTLPEVISVESIMNRLPLSLAAAGFHFLAAPAFAESTAVSDPLVAAIAAATAEADAIRLRDDPCVDHGLRILPATAFAVAGEGIGVTLANETGATVLAIEANLEVVDALGRATTLAGAIPRHLGVEPGDRFTLEGNYGLAEELDGLPPEAWSFRICVREIALLTDEGIVRSTPER